MRHCRQFPRSLRAPIVYEFWQTLPAYYHEPEADLVGGVAGGLNGLLGASSVIFAVLGHPNVRRTPQDVMVKTLQPKNDDENSGTNNHGFNWCHRLSDRSTVPLGTLVA